MQINVRQSSKSRILLNMIDNYQKSPDDEALLEASKNSSVAQIERRFKKSQVNQSYAFPRTEENNQKINSESPISKQFSPKEQLQQKDSFKDLLKKIYLSNLKKNSRKTQINPEFIKQQYSILQQSHRKSFQTLNKSKLQQSLSQNRLLTDVGYKQSYSRGQSPENKQFYSNRPVGTQLSKFINQNIKEKQLSQYNYNQQNSCRSFELRYQFNKSPYSQMQNKSFDLIKQLQQFSSLQKVKSKNN
ncbi:unnamed protein product (macronuclear) [Paramecium tetraurelia]|uniref:Uncharacterized protein n=1 Tax=Paramecium tetraurelia TaxID=5888 RepID=A0CML0_PARTE|nr:uncharacterized protein GSPATT00008506001 [Paramecium tetraurelia]CAK72027.1 unnamed protein product [Paramecium tetraurelia]|eukprot:XP_001439424.1 hypothetical protein (macronuclear) [Paramecium tetraurelia strain d4-2]